MKKIKLTEKDIVKLVKQTIKESREKAKKRLSPKKKIIHLSEDSLISLIEKIALQEIRDASPIGFGRPESLGVAKPTDKYKEEMEEGYAEDYFQKKLTGQTQLPPEDEDDMAPDGMGDDSDTDRAMMKDEVVREQSKGGKWMQKLKLKKGAFTEWCKSRGLLDSDGKVGCECVRAGKKSDDSTTVRRATLAGTFIGKDC